MAFQGDGSTCEMYLCLGSKEFVVFRFMSRDCVVSARSRFVPQSFPQLDHLDIRRTFGVWFESGEQRIDEILAAFCSWFRQASVIVFSEGCEGFQVVVPGHAEEQLLYCPSQNQQPVQ